MSKTTYDAAAVVGWGVTSLVKLYLTYKAIAAVTSFSVMLLSGYGSYRCAKSFKRVAHRQQPNA